jgi:FtsP/CotA-like multicopper oxidase with cupredoxin domain
MMPAHNLLLAVASTAVAAFGIQLASERVIPDISNPPEVRAANGVATFTLTAINRSDGRASMEYNGSRMLPTIRLWPGDQMKVTYVNDLVRHSIEKCALGPCMDMTNLHFHGLGVSPDAPQDDVLSMLAQPGQTLRYDVVVPKSQAPGLYWIHTHPHGESAEQDLDGMSTAVVVEGIDRYVPQVRGLRERIMVVRTFDPPKSQIERSRAFTDVPPRDCGTSGEQVEGFPTINGTLRPSIAIAPGERQFWRIVNAQPDAFLNLHLDGGSFQVVALDGQPLAFNDPHRAVETMRNVFLPPAGRVEAIVTGPKANAHATLRTLCVNTGPAGDINQGGVLADIDSHSPSGPMATVPVSTQPPVYRSINVANVERSAPDFTVLFTEGHHRFYINHRLFNIADKPMVTARVGTFAHWHVINRTKEMHPFHIHQVHFLTYAVNGRKVQNPKWLDTMNVLPNGTIDVVMDFTNPVIRGMAVFHCHILKHEDKGMMAKVLFK